VNSRHAECCSDLAFAFSIFRPVIKTVNEAQLKADLDPNGVAFIYLHKDDTDTADVSY
jgi:hypothetical protein